MVRLYGVASAAWLLMFKLPRPTNMTLTYN